MLKNSNKNVAKQIQKKPKKNTSRWAKRCHLNLN